MMFPLSHLKGNSHGQTQQVQSDLPHLADPLSQLFPKDYKSSKIISLIVYTELLF